MEVPGSQNETVPKEENSFLSKKHLLKKPEKLDHIKSILTKSKEKDVKHNK